MKLCELVYENFVTEHGYGQKLVRCIPHPNVMLWEISATYANPVKPCAYYVLGRTKKEAKERFMNCFSWLYITNIRYIPPGDEAENILTNPFKMPTR